MSVLNFTLAPELQDLRLRAAKVAAEGVEKFGRFTDSWMNGYSSEFSQMMASEGWIGMSWPKKHGGYERSSIERVIVGEEMISAGAPIAGMWFADRQMGPSLITHGTPEQQEKYLPGMLNGTATWCIGMSEPDSGSDLASLKTFAENDGEQWVINGPKNLDKFWGSSRLHVSHMPNN